MSAWRLARRGKYEPDVEAALKRLVQRGMVCVDAGAYVGTFSTLMARLVGPGGHVYAFEPAPANVERRREAVARYGDRVTVEAAALTRHGGEIEIYAGRRGSPTEWTVDPAFASREDAEPQPERATMRVPAVALDEYFD